MAGDQLWFRDQGHKFPLQMSAHAEVQWVEASYHAIHQVLSNPVYAGAYVYGKTRTEMALDASGVRRKRIRHLPRDQWQVLIKEHHRGFIDWQTYEANQQRIARNTRPGPHNTGGAVREGGALLQGIASCGHCGRRLRTHYRGRNSAPGYHCAGEHLVEGRGSYCLNIGGVQIDEAVACAFIAALEPAKIAATLAAAERLEADRESALKHWRLGVERASYAAGLAERRYRAVDPDNRLVARGLERAWEESLAALEAAKMELASHERERPRVLSSEERSRLGTLAPDLATIWTAAMAAASSLLFLHGRPPAGANPTASPSARTALGWRLATRMRRPLTSSTDIRWSPLPGPDTDGLGNGGLAIVMWSKDGGTLYAGGAYHDGRGRPVLAWANAGRGERRALPAGSDTVGGLAALPDGGLLVAATGPVPSGIGS